MSQWRWSSWWLDDPVGPQLFNACVAVSEPLAVNELVVLANRRRRPQGRCLGLGERDRDAHPDDISNAAKLRVIERHCFAACADTWIAYGVRGRADFRCRDSMLFEQRHKDRRRHCARESFDVRVQFSLIIPEIPPANRGWTSPPRARRGIQAVTGIPRRQP